MHSVAVIHPATLPEAEAVKYSPESSILNRIEAVRVRDFRLEQIFAVVVVHMENGMRKVVICGARACTAGTLGSGKTADEDDAHVPFPTPPPHRPSY